MRIFLVCLVVAGCASQSKKTPAAAATVMAGSMPSNAPAPEPRTTPQAGPSAAKPTVPGPTPAAAPPAGGATTAAEAAAALSAQRGGGAGDGASSASGSSPGAPSSPESDDGACASDADCIFTRAAPGACCPMLCTPRAVTRKAADALDEQMKSCAKSHECPQPSCRPPRMMTTPACVQSRCVVKVHDEKGMQ